MTILISAFGMAGRFAGDLLTTALGWASSLLFGRVPRDHQIFVVLMMAGSFLWTLVLLGLLIPSIASFYLAATPHPPFIDQAWLAFVLVLSAIVLPLFVGLAGYLVPTAERREAGPAVLKELLRGYLLAPLITGLLIFLAAVGMTRKARSKRHHWQDVHVPIVMEPGGYDELAADLEDCLRNADLPVVSRDAPRVLSAPAWLLTRVAGANVGSLRPDRLIELGTRNLRVGVYPSDIAISGSDRARIRARAAILARLVTSPAHMVTSAEGQAVEDRLRKLAESAPSSGHMPRARMQSALSKIDSELLALPIPTDEWDVLYLLRLQVERDLLIGEQPGSVWLGSESGAGGKADAGSAPRAADSNADSDADADVDSESATARRAAARSATARP